ncbi:MAG: type II toxin-antitoxin system VapC family toxin [Candidatus Competibacteraceae bacterium]
MDIIADTNVFLAIALNEPEKSHIIKLTTQASVFAPEILPYEIGNALSAMVKRHRLTVSEALEAERLTSRIPVRLVGVDVGTSLQIALQNNLYAYDAYFLQCARTFAHPLLTLDRRLKQVAGQLGIKLLE